MTTWNKTLTEYTGVDLKPDQAEYWLTELTSQFHGLTESEIQGAIREATRQQDKYAKKPTLASLRAWIAMYRSTGKSNETPKQNEVDLDWCRGIFQRMLKAPDYVTAWNMLCQPEFYAFAGRDSTMAECQLLERWAEEHIEGFHRPTVEELTGQNKSIDDALGDLLGDRNDAP